MIIKNLFIFSSCLINKIEKREKSTAATLKLLIIIFTMVWLATACKDNSNSAPDVPDNTVAMNWSSDSLNLQTNNTIHFIVYNPTYKYYSFEINDSLQKIVQKGLCIYDSISSIKYNANYIISVDKSFTPGKYVCSMFTEDSLNFNYKNNIHVVVFYVK